jgi:hypothetical protein
LIIRGLPFHCSSCRRTGHLKHDCPSWNGSEVAEDSTSTQENDLYMSEENAKEVGSFLSVSEADSTGTLTDSYLGKLKYYCPSLFFKLSSWEKDFLEKTIHFDTFSTPETSSSVKNNLVLGGLNRDDDRVPEALLLDPPIPSLLGSTTTVLGGGGGLWRILFNLSLLNLWMPSHRIQTWKH